MQARLSQNLMSCLQAYGKLLDNITRHTGLDASSILDMRGNHDAFDVPKRQGKRPQPSSSTFLTNAYTHEIDRVVDHGTKMLIVAWKSSWNNPTAKQSNHVQPGLAPSKTSSKWHLTTKHTKNKQVMHVISTQSGCACTNKCFGIKGHW